MRKIRGKIHSFAPVEPCFMETMFWSKCFKFSSLWAMLVIDLLLLSCWKSQNKLLSYKKMKNILVNRYSEFYFWQMTFQSLTPHWAHAKLTQQELSTTLPEQLLLQASSSPCIIWEQWSSLLWFGTQILVWWQQGIFLQLLKGWPEQQRKDGSKMVQEMSLDVPVQLRQWLNLADEQILFFPRTSSILPYVSYSSYWPWSTAVCHHCSQLWRNL